jgi:hypothetical protein
MEVVNETLHTLLDSENNKITIQPTTIHNSNDSVCIKCLRKKYKCLILWLVCTIAITQLLYIILDKLDERLLNKLSNKLYNFLSVKLHNSNFSEVHNISQKQNYV